MNETSDEKALFGCEYSLMKDPKMIFKLDLPPLLLIHQFSG